MIFLFVLSCSNAHAGTPEVGYCYQFSRSWLPSSIRSVVSGLYVFLVLHLAPVVDLFFCVESLFGKHEMMCIS